MPVTSSPIPRIGIVVTDVYAAEDPDYDTPLLLPALAARGADPTAVVDAVLRPLAEEQSRRRREGLPPTARLRILERPIMNAPSLHPLTTQRFGDPRP